MSKTGRFFIKKGGRTFLIEPIDNTKGKGKAVWGDVNPATGKVEGNYGIKDVGSVTESESIILKENGFKNIKTLGVGESPESYIENLIAEGK